MLLEFAWVARAPVPWRCHWVEDGVCRGPGVNPGSAASSYALSGQSVHLPPHSQLPLRAVCTQSIPPSMSVPGLGLRSAAVQPVLLALALVATADDVVRPWAGTA